MSELEQFKLLVFQMREKQRRCSISNSPHEKYMCNQLESQVDKQLHHLQLEAKKGSSKPPISDLFQDLK